MPLSRADEEFVSGRMTQAEILEKYGLVTQAMDQIYEVIERFPGHLEANQHLVTLLRGTSQESALAQADSYARRLCGKGAPLASSASMSLNGCSRAAIMCSESTTSTTTTT